MEKTTITNVSKDLYNHLNEQGKLEYGSFVSELEIHEFLGLVYPEHGTRAQYKALDLTMLAVTDYIKSILLGEGKAFVSSQGDYRVLLPSENAKYIEKYMRAADKKLKRALKLSRNQPLGDVVQDNKSVKIMLKQEALKREMNKQNQLK